MLMNVHSFHIDCSTMEIRCVRQIVMTFLLLNLLSLLIGAQAPEIPLYAGSAPGSEMAPLREVVFTTPDGQRRIRNVGRPTLTAWVPRDRVSASLPAVIIAPGGGFMHLAMEKEGADVARWLVEQGIAAFVLKYRTMDTGATEDEFKKYQQILAAALRPPVSASAEATSVLRRDPNWRRAKELAILDGQQAIRLLRQRSREFGIDPRKIGMLGFSAGGMVTLGTVLGEDLTGRPDFAAPIYGGSTDGATVPSDAPPLFIVVADDDHLAAAGSARLYLDWRAAGRSAELHVYAQGGHGFGMLKRGLPADSWIDRFGDWMKSRGIFIPPPLSH
jgi:acetyl esterase/lipase